MAFRIVVDDTGMDPLRALARGVRLLFGVSLIVAGVLVSTLPLFIVVVGLRSCQSAKQTAREPGLFLLVLIALLVATASWWAARWLCAAKRIVHRIVAAALAKPRVLLGTVRKRIKRIGPPHCST